MQIGIVQSLHQRIECRDVGKFRECEMIARATTQRTQRFFAGGNQSHIEGTNDRTGPGRVFGVHRFLARHNVVDVQGVDHRLFLSSNICLSVCADPPGLQTGAITDRRKELESKSII